MAWYRAGGGGIPSSLKTGMDSVLNKKFGTSTTYPAEDWPDTVNLMGPLPEKTASGAIVTFPDGADEVPIKSWEVTLPASLDGYSSVDVVSGGKNFLSSAPAETKTNNSVYITCDGNGKYTLSGTATGGSSNIRFELSEPSKIANGMYLHFKNNTYTTVSSLSFERADQTTIFSLTPAPADRIYDMSSYAGEEVCYIRFYVMNNGTVDYFLSPMFCFESTATTYEPYTAPTIHTASLGRTIYGGSVDVVKGTGTDENGNDFTFTPITPTPETALGVNNFWADSGDSEVTYRADINLALGGQ